MAFQANLQTDYIRRLDVINRGLSGFTSQMGLKALQHFLPADRHELWPNIKLTTVFFGANDACIPGQLQHVDLDSYIKALREIFDHLHAQKQQKQIEIVVITPPPVNEHQSGRMPNGQFQRQAGITSQYAQAAQRLAQNLGLPCVDLWTLLMKRVGWQESMGRDCCSGHIGNATALGISTVQHIPGCIHAKRVLPHSEHCLDDFLVDGLHLTQLGYNLLYYDTMRVINTQISACAPENLPMVIPPWKEAIESMSHNNACS